MYERPPIRRCLVIQHAEPDAPYAIATALRSAGIELDLRRVDRGAALPVDLAPYDGLVVLGGPMSAAEDAGFATRRAELTLIDTGIAGGIPVLGVCLGAQLIAIAAGAAVSRDRSGPEIGWGPVEFSGSCRFDPLFSGVPEHSTVLHWHGETFSLPQGAIALASSTRCANQAFRLGDSIWGLQFHLEVTDGAVERFIAEFPADAAGAWGGPAAIEAATSAGLLELAPVRDLVLVRFAALVAQRAFDPAIRAE